MTVPGGISISNGRPAERTYTSADRPSVPAASEGMKHGEVLCNRGAYFPCRATYRSLLRARLKSTDKFCNGPTELSDQRISPSAQRFCGPSKRLHSLPLSAEQASAQRSGGSLVRSSRQSKSFSKQCAVFSVSGANSSCGGVEGNAPFEGAKPPRIQGLRERSATILSAAEGSEGRPGDALVPGAGVESCPRETYPNNWGEGEV